MSQHHTTPADEIEGDEVDPIISTMHDLEKFDTDEIGTTGLRSSGGYIDDEQIKELRGREGIKTYRRMADNDPIIGAFLFAIEMLIRQVTFDVTPKDESPKAEEIAETMETILFEDMEHTWDDFLTEVLNFLWAGFAPMETVLKRRRGTSADPKTNSLFNDGLIGVRKIALRAPETIDRWELSDHDDVIGLWQQPDTGSLVYIPASRFMLFRTKSNRNNPQGRSLLRNAYRPWLFKTRMEEIEGIGVERDLAGLPVVRVPGQLFEKNATPDQKRTLQAYKTMAQNIKRDKQEGIVLPNTRDAAGELLYDVSLLSSGGTRQFDTTKIIDRYDRRIAMTVLAEFIFLGETSGSWALSSDKTALFATAVSAILKRIVEPFNAANGLIPYLMRVNGFDETLTPKLTHGDIESLDLDQIARTLTAMAGNGATIFPDRDLENMLRQRMGLPAAPEEDVGGETVARDEKMFPNKNKPADKTTDDAE